MILFIVFSLAHEDTKNVLRSSFFTEKFLEYAVSRIIYVQTTGLVDLLPESDSVNKFAVHFGKGRWVLGILYDRTFSFTSSILVLVTLMILNWYLSIVMISCTCGKLWYSCRMSPPIV